MDYPARVEDRQAVYFAMHHERLRTRLRGLVTDALIEEHRLKPVGQHSDGLERLLNYFRRGGMAGKLGLHRSDGDPPEYRIVRFSGARGIVSVIEDDAVFTSLNEAYHAIFLRRVAELMAG